MAAERQLSYLRGKDIAPREVTHFMLDAREALIQKGYAIYTLTGASIQTHREANRPFMSSWHRDVPYFEALPSRQNMEVAINVANPYLPKSNERTLAEQLGLIADFSQKIAQEIPGTAAIMGEAADYVDVAFQHLAATAAAGSPQYLFGPKNFNDYVRTQTGIYVTNVANVGRFNHELGISLYHMPKDRRLSSVHAMPLIIPIFNFRVLK